MATEFAHMLQRYNITTRDLALRSGVSESDIEDIKRNGAKNIKNIDFARLFQRLELMIGRPIKAEEKMQLMEPDLNVRVKNAVRLIREDPGTYMPRVNGVPVTETQTWQSLERERVAGLRRQRGQ